jgi:hypothetical protein
LRQNTKGHKKCISLKPHNNVEIIVCNQTHVFVHVSSFKPYHDNSKFQNFTDNFQKQGDGKILIFHLRKI